MVELLERAGSGPTLHLGLGQGADDPGGLQERLDLEGGLEPTVEQVHGAFERLEGGHRRQATCPVRRSIRPAAEAPVASRRVERFGFVGLPNVGKSSPFNALAGGGALAAPYAFATTDPNVGVAQVPDHRLHALAEMSASRSVVPAVVEFVDIGGLVEGASKGEGLGNRFLAGIREVDAVVLVLRAFADGDVPGPADPLEHLAVLETELTLADLEAVESRVDRRRKAARAEWASSACPRDRGGGARGGPCGAGGGDADLPLGAR